MTPAATKAQCFKEILHVHLGKPHPAAGTLVWRFGRDALTGLGKRVPCDLPAQPQIAEAS